MIFTYIKRIGDINLDTNFCYDVHNGKNAIYSVIYNQRKA